MSRRRILVLLSSAGGGDRQPVVALAVALQRTGHQVHVLCDSPLAPTAEQAGLPYSTHNVVQVGYISTWAKDPDQATNPLVAWGEAVAVHAMAAARAFEPDVVVASLFTLGLAALVAEDLGVSTCFVNPSFYFGEGSDRSWDDDWYGSFVPRLASECFLPLVASMDLVLHATDPGFDFVPQKMPEGHHYVGFLHWEPQSVAAPFLDEVGDPWVLVTASTARPGEEETMLSSALAALESRQVRVLLTQPVRSYELPNTRNSVNVGYMPHTPILERSAMSVNHAGHGIVSKCVAMGVPMVLLPWDADQPGVAARAKANGLATVVARADVGSRSVAHAVAEVLDDPAYRLAALEMRGAVRDRAISFDPVSLVEAV